MWFFFVFLYRLFYLIWNEYLFNNKIINIYQFSEQIFSWIIQLTPIQAFPCTYVSFQCHRLSTVSHRRWQESVKYCKQHAEDPSEKAVVQISLTEYIMKCYHDMVEQTPQQRNVRPWNQWESHCFGDLTFEIRARAVRHVIEHEGTPVWTKAKPSPSRRSH